MQKCSGRHCGPCSCPSSSSSSSSSSLSMFLSSSSYLPNVDVFPAVQVVDCTLSLATPSSTSPQPPHDTRRISTPSTHFYWDIFPPPPPPSSFVHDNIAPRQCANCHTTSTPLWRNGPLGPKSLCNACGIRYKKEERRAAAAARVNGGSDGSGVAAVGREAAQRVVKNTSSWALPQYTQALQKKGCFSTSAAHGGGRSELRFLDVGHRRRDPDVISWRHLSDVVFFPANRSPAIVHHDFITNSAHY